MKKNRGNVEEIRSVTRRIHRESKQAQVFYWIFAFQNEINWICLEGIRSFTQSFSDIHTTINSPSSVFIYPPVVSSCFFTRFRSASSIGCCCCYYSQSFSFAHAHSQPTHMHRFELEDFVFAFVVFELCVIRSTSYRLHISLFRQKKKILYDKYSSQQKEAKRKKYTHTRRPTRKKLKIIWTRVQRNFCLSWTTVLFGESSGLKYC